MSQITTNKLTENSVYINEFTTTEDSKTSDARFGDNPGYGTAKQVHDGQRKMQSSALVSPDACNNA